MTPYEQGHLIAILNVARTRLETAARLMREGKTSDENLLFTVKLVDEQLADAQKIARGEQNETIV